MKNINQHWLLDLGNTLKDKSTNDLLELFGSENENIEIINKVVENSVLTKQEIIDLFAIDPNFFHENILNGKSFTEINQFIIGGKSKIKTKLLHSQKEILGIILQEIPNIKELYPKIFQMIIEDDKVGFEIAMLINSYKKQQLGLLYIPGFHRSLQGPIGSDILPHIVPLLNENLENINFNYPGNGFLGKHPEKDGILSWDVFKTKNHEEFKQNFDFEIFEFLIFLIIKISKSVECFYSHSLGPVFAVKILNKLGNDANKIKNTIFLNPALDQEKLTRFWFINEIADNNIEQLTQNNIINPILLDQFLKYRKKSNFVWAFFISTFFENGKFLLENEKEWINFKNKNNQSYVKTCFDQNFLHEFDKLPDRIKGQIITISTEGYTTVPMDSLRDNENNIGIEGIINIDLKDHYGNNEKGIGKIKEKILALIKR